MAILQQQDKATLRDRFDVALKRDVKLTLVTRTETALYIPGRECPSCRPTRQLLEEMVELNPKLHLEVVDFYAEPQKAASLGVELIPAILIEAGGRSNARFYGLPSGLEFVVLVEDVIAAASRRSPLSLEARRQLKGLREDVHIQVFTTPT